MNRIKVAIIGIGNCASSLIQGIHYYRDKVADDAIGLKHWENGGYKPFDIEVVAAFDVDKHLELGENNKQRLSAYRDLFKFVLDKNLIKEISSSLQTGTPLCNKNVKV